MWGVVLKLMAYEMGETAEDVHELMKQRHNSKTVADPQTGEDVKIAQSTAKLTISEFSEYLERVMLDGQTYLGLTFPEPRREDDWRETKVAA